MTKSARRHINSVSQPLRLSLTDHDTIPLRRRKRFQSTITAPDAPKPQRLRIMGRTDHSIEYECGFRRKGCPRVRRLETVLVSRLHGTFHPRSEAKRLVLAVTTMGTIVLLLPYLCSVLFIVADGIPGTCNQICRMTYVEPFLRHLAQFALDL